MKKIKEKIKELDDECNIPKGQVNSKVARLNAGFTLAFAIIYIFSFANWILIIIIADFVIKSFINPRFSPTSIISNRLLRLFRVKPKPIFAAPKLFASKVGFTFSAVSGIFYLLGLLSVSKIILAILAVFAMLEFVFEFCAGCWMHSYYIKYKDITKS